MPKSKDSKTHFEQIPLEIVKKIAEEDIPDDVADGADVSIQLPAKKCSVFPRLRRATVNAREPASHGVMEDQKWKSIKSDGKNLTSKTQKFAPEQRY